MSRSLHRPEDYDVRYVIQFYKIDVKHLQENSNDVKKPKGESDNQFAYYYEFFLVDYIYNVICVS